MLGLHVAIETTYGPREWFISQ